MNLLVIFLVLLSALIHALRNFYTKKANDKIVFIWLYELVGTVIFLPVFVYYLLQNGTGSFFGIAIGAVSGLLHALYWIFHGKAYETGDLSHVYPIMRSAPALVLLFAVIFLNEQVSLIGVIGILVVAMGVYTINIKKISFSGLIEPLKHIFKEKGTQFAFLTLISVAVYSIVDKIGVGFVHPILFTYFYTFFGFFFFTPYILYISKKSAILKEWAVNKKSVLINGFFATFGYMLILIALTLEKVSYVTGLRQVSVVIAVLLGGHILKEKHKLIRSGASFLIFIGAFLISIAK